MAKSAGRTTARKAVKKTRRAVKTASGKAKSELPSSAAVSKALHRLAAIEGRLAKQATTAAKQAANKVSHSRAAKVAAGAVAVAAAGMAVRRATRKKKRRW